MSRRHGGAQSVGLNVGYGNAYDGNAYDYPSTNSDSAKRTVNNPYVTTGTGNDLYPVKKIKNNFSNRYSGVLKVLPWLVSVVFIGLFITTRVQLSSARWQVLKGERVIEDEVNSCARRIKQLNDSNTSLKDAAKSKTGEISQMRDQWQTQTVELRGEIRAKSEELRMKHTELQAKSVAAETAGLVQSQVVDMKTRENAWKKRVDRLTRKIERESYREALERFGQGPHRVKFQVELPRDSEKDAMIPDGEHPSFIIELYSLNDMPHAVHLFLEQVYHGLWDGCSFVVNAPHILQAGTFPGGNSVETYADKIKAFEEMGLDTVSYQEYNAAKPHLQWTVGFAGRPGGPDFFINKMDNTKNHGPGGQHHHTIGEEADPCFGIVIEGYNVLQRMYDMETDAKNDWVMAKPVHIVKARILDGSDDVYTMRDPITGRKIPHLSDMHGMGLPTDIDNSVTNTDKIRDQKPLPPLPEKMQGGAEKVEVGLVGSPR